MSVENKNNDINNAIIENKELKSHKLSIWSFLVYVYYFLILASSIYIMQQLSGVVINLGDFGEITWAVLYVLSVTSLKWIPLLSICGVLLYNKRNKVKEISFLYLFFVSLIYVVSLIIVLIKV